MNTSSVYIHSLSALSNSGRAPELREGDFVSVRVLSADGHFSGKAGGTYTLSFAGQRFAATSDLKLTPGSVFKAQILLKDGKLNLVPQSVLSAGNNEFSVKSILPPEVFAGLELLQANIPSELASLFTSIGLVPDSITLKIFQQLQQLGARIDTKLMAKVRAAALRFPGKEFSAAEIALLLEEKNLESTDESIEKILEFDKGSNSADDTKPDEESFSGGKEQNYGQQKDGRQQKQQKENSNQDAAFRNSIKDQIFNVNSDFYKSGNSDGLLSIFNHLKNADNNHHWIIIPYNFTSRNGLEGKGSLKFLFDVDLKTLKKCVIFARTKRQEYRFVLYYSVDRCLKDVLFSIKPEPEADIENLKNVLKDFLASENPVNVEWAENGISPFSTENSELNFAEGLI